jgi:hypothetical protein
MRRDFGIHRKQTAATPRRLKMKKFSVGEAKARMLHGLSIKDYLMEGNVTPRWQMDFLAGVLHNKFGAASLDEALTEVDKLDYELLALYVSNELVECIYGQGHLNPISAIIAMRTVPWNAFPNKLINTALKILKDSTAHIYNPTQDEELEEECAKLVYQKVDRTYVETLKPYVQDYISLLDAIEYDGDFQ